MIRGVSYLNGMTVRKKESLIKVYTKPLIKITREVELANKKPEPD